MYRTNRWGYPGRLVKGEGSGSTNHRPSLRSLVLTRGGCSTYAYDRTNSYVDLILALARGGQHSLPKHCARGSDVSVGHVAL